MLTVALVDLSGGRVFRLDGPAQARLVLRPHLWFHPHARLEPRVARAEDLEASIRAALDAGHLALPVGGMTTIDDRTLRVTLDRPVGDLAQPLADVALVPAELGQVEDLTDMRCPVGAGPVPGVPVAGGGLSLLAHARSWRSRPEAPPPGVERLVVRVLGDTQDWNKAVDHVVCGRVDVVPLPYIASEPEVRARADAAGVEVEVAVVEPA